MMECVYFIIRFIKFLLSYVWILWSVLLLKWSIIVIVNIGRIRSNYCLFQDMILLSNNDNSFCRYWNLYPTIHSKFNISKHMCILRCIVLAYDNISARSPLQLSSVTTHLYIFIYLNSIYISFIVISNRFCQLKIVAKYSAKNV